MREDVLSVLPDIQEEENDSMIWLIYDNGSNYRSGGEAVHVQCQKLCLSKPEVISFPPS